MLCLEMYLTIQPLYDAYALAIQLQPSFCSKVLMALHSTRIIRKIWILGLSSH